MSRFKVFGNEPTSLCLSEKADKLYSNTDPLDIYEMEDGTYQLHGAYEIEGLTEKEVNQILEDGYDETYGDEVSEQVKDLRRSTGLSQGKFADKFGIPLSTLQHWEQGVNAPPPYVLNMLEKMVKELPR